MARTGDPQKHRESAARYRLAHRDELREQDRAYKLLNRDKIKERNKQYRIANNERLNENKVQARAQDIERYRKRDRLHYARKKGLLNKSCQACGYDRFVEFCHIVPRCEGGPDDQWNILYLCHNCHFMLDKHPTKFTPEEWDRIKDKVESARTTFLQRGETLRLPRGALASNQGVQQLPFLADLA
jgi:5-methylcytosine-specific restriction endonuclease McrA